MFDKLSEHNWFKVALVSANFLAYVTMVGFNVLASFPSSGSKRLFPTDVGAISDAFYIDIVPAGWVFSTIWTIIFVWNFIWMAYALVCLLRRTKDGSYLYRRFDFFNYGMFISFMVNNLAIIAWLFVWTNKYAGWSFFLIVITVIPLDICMLILVRKVYQLKEEMKQNKLKVDLVLVRVLAQNGISFFATWLSLATCLNFAQFLKNDCGADQSVAATISLFIILSIAVVYFIIENIIWPRYLLYTFSPWFVINLALIGSLTKNWNTTSPSRNNVITLVLLIITILLAIAKIVMFILYQTCLKHRLNRKVMIATTEGDEKVNVL